MAKVLIEDASGDLKAKSDIEPGSQEGAELNARVSRQLRLASIDMQADQDMQAGALASSRPR